VIVICAGHNDLTYTCNLTKAVLKVLVLEEYHTLECITITEELKVLVLNLMFMLLAINM
jgi:hypothetical protein